MNFTKKLKTLHLVSTVWFMLCTGYVFILALRQTGFNWLVIFSLSGHLSLLVILLVCIYLFVLFRGVEKVPDMQSEHPLTSTSYYMIFYVSMPFMGAFAGLLGIIGEAPLSSYLPAAAMGTIGATFLTWVAIDGITGSVELLLPKPRAYRLQRLADIRAKKQQEQAQRDKLLDDIFEQEHKNRILWERELAAKAEQLAGLLTCDDNGWESAQQQAIDIGVDAWRAGGLTCMRQLQNMAFDAYKRSYGARQYIDYISAWWDGIGSWRIPAAE